jgi:hypothetical protein
LSQEPAIGLVAARVLAIADLAREILVEVVPERRVPAQLEAGRVPSLVLLEAREFPAQYAFDAQL